MISDWVKLADKFADDGDAESMFGAANEIFELDKNSAEGYAILAEANLYLGDLNAAEKFARRAGNLRGRLVLGGIAAENFNLADEFKILDAVINDARALHADKILCKALCWISNGLYLAGDAKTAAEYLREASTLTENIERAAELYSKHLFFQNYNEPVQKSVAQDFNKFFANIQPYTYQKNYSHKKIRIGYISPDFRQHAVANFILPLIRNFDAEKFSVTCYQTGRSDFVTAKLQFKKIRWRNLQNLDAATSARIIFDDEIDILVDLSGHSQNSCLPILAHKPAPIQITALGYVSTTGLNAIDYFLSDKISGGGDFTEKILQLDGCHLCYAPILKMPAITRTEKKFVTFGCFNNFAKVNDAVLELWLKILRAVPNSRLILKNKTCSIESGREIILRRMKDFPLDRLELRPYGKDYLAQYNEIDIALDTFPYNGGLTTCEALYMGVPVISLRGNYHGANFGASILTAAGLPELIAENPDDYVKKAVEFSQRRFDNLREKIKKSALMDGKNYLRELEKIYQQIYKLKWNA